MSEVQLKNCPKCGNSTQSLVPVDTALRVSLGATGTAKDLPPQVCQACYESLSGQVTKGVKLRMEQTQREKNKMMLWKSRVNLVKSGRQLMAQRAFSDAAVSYEKYIRVLEMVYNKKKGELSPEVFNNSIRSKELTVVASVYWDLLRIYDTSPRYGNRMQQTAQKLAQFLPFSPIQPDVLKKAESFVHTANNPEPVEEFLKAMNVSKGTCFIATAIFADPDAPEVKELRKFRDEVLAHTQIGQKFILLYNRFSPPLAKRINNYPPCRRLLKPLLTTGIRGISCLRHTIERQMVKNAAQHKKDSSNF